MCFRGVNSGRRRMTREITSERSARQRRGWPSLRRRDMMYRVCQLSKDSTMERCSRQRQEVSVRTDSAFMTWEGMSGSGARTNTNRARPRGCCAAVRGSMTTATACCRPTASTAIPIVASESIGFRAVVEAGSRRQRALVFAYLLQDGEKIYEFIVLAWACPDSDGCQGMVRIGLAGVARFWNNNNRDTCVVHRPFPSRNLGFVRGRAVARNLRGSFG